MNRHTRAVGVAFAEVVLPRLAERSTWIGIMAFLTVLIGHAAPIAAAAPLADIGATFAAIALVVIREERGE